MYCIIIIVIIMSCRVTIWRAGFLESNPEQKRLPDTVSHSLLFFWYISMILGIIHPLFFGDHGFFELQISFIGASKGFKNEKYLPPTHLKQYGTPGSILLNTIPDFGDKVDKQFGESTNSVWLWLRAIWDLHWTLRLDLLFYGCCQIIKFLNSNTFFS